MVNWDQFSVCNSNPRIAFEDLCRMLFRHLYLSPGTELMMAPNNPGVEVEPVWDRNNEKRISYQSKFFDNTPDYQQILHSIEETIKYYAGKIDRVYLYCNKKLTPTANMYVKAKGVLQANSIELIPVCDDEILDQVREDSLAEHTYFGVPLLTNDWIKRRLSMSLAALGKRYNQEFNIETDTQRRFELFLCNSASANILNGIKTDVVKELSHYVNAYGAGRTLARKLLSAVSALEPVCANNLLMAYGWYDSILQQCADDITAANEKIRMLQEQVAQMDTQNRKSYMRHDIDQIQGVLDALSGLRINDEDKSLLQSKVLMVTGDAGMGKSQMFAETARNCVGQSDAVILMLGGSFLNSDPIGTQIVNILGLGCSFDAFLDKLEGMAERADKYSYIMIDALNECGNKKVWMNNIVQLIQQLSDYKRIKIAISLRTGYDQFMFGNRLDTFFATGVATKLRHRGFWNDSIPAIRAFLDHYEIPFLPAYALSTDMKNPLYLTLFCENYTGEMVDIGRLFDTVIGNVDEEVRTCIGKEDAAPFLQSFIDEFLELRLQKGYLSINMDHLLTMNFWHKYGLEGDKTRIIAMLVRANLLSTQLWHDEELFSFTYQKMDDMLCAKHLLKKLAQKGAIIGCIVSDLLEIEDGAINSNSNIDIAVEMCSLFALRNGEEIFDEVVGYLSDSYDRASLAELYFRAFSQRTSENLSQEYVLSFLKTYTPNPNVVFEVFIENSIKENHPLNADALHKLLLKWPIAHRDYMWTLFVNNRASEEDRLYQLLEYFEKGNTFANISKKNAELFLTLVVWLFTASNRHLRDKATKVAVELLRRQFSLCKVLLGKFASVDDPYVIERLYCSIYGACLKRKEMDMETYSDLVQYIYDNFFLSELVYPDVLTRDFARSIIERWLYENGGDSSAIDVAQIRPPYRSEPIPTVEAQEYSSYSDHESGMLLIDRSMRVNAGESPGMYGDFGRYTFQSALEYFENTDIVNLYHYAMQYIRDTLGYTDDYFGREDRFYYRFGPYNRQRAVQERIGKKYQWIALHHILSRVSDHAEVDKYGKKAPYTGPWNPYVRDIDPSYNSAITISSSLPVFCSYKVSEKEYLHKENVQQSDIDEWCGSMATLHQTLPERMLLMDDDGQEWVVLLRFEDEKQEPIVEERTGIGYPNGTQEIWAHTRGYFVKRSERESLDDAINNIITKGNPPDLSDGPDVYQLFSREYPWAPGVCEVLGDCWHYFEIETGNRHVMKSDSPVIRLIMQYGHTDADAEVLEIPQQWTETETSVAGAMLPVQIRVLQGERSDASNSENTSYYIPCTELLERLNLSQNQDNGIFVSASGEVVAFDPTLVGGFDGLVIRKSYLDRFLDENQYDLVWYVCGEKQYFHGDNEQTWLTLRGLFNLNKEGVKGNWGYSHCEHSH